MFCFHYTSKKNLLNIRRSGFLKTYHLGKNVIALRRVGIDIKKGIWAWTQNPKGLSHTGNVLRTAAVRNDTNVVKLKVWYTYGDVLTAPEGGGLSMVHDGNIENLEYHKDEKAIILKKNIPYENIEVIGEYNLIDLLNK